MKPHLFVVWLALLGAPTISARCTEADPVQAVVLELQVETSRAVEVYFEKAGNLETKRRRIDSDLLHAVSTERKLELLIERQYIADELRAIRMETDNELAKIRYLKGLQIVKILYEKVLSLDHHFAGVRTLAEINKISNPNQYPEFAKFRELIQSKRDRKTGFDISSLLGTNPLVSVVQTLTNLVNSSLSKDDREKELQKVECILDFTLRMQNDLNTIFFETSFLQSSNDRIKQDIESLFREYAKPIGYYATLENCRVNDDWETVTQKMDDYLTRMKNASGSTQYKMQVNIEFPIDRLMQFINQYNNFIDQGGKFYEKFRIILNSYENERQCETKLPTEYQKLKADIDLAVNKFNVAYKPVEINGSKMKEILYGLNEFD